MDIWRIIKSIAVAILMILGGILIITEGEEGYLYVVLILSMTLIVSGIGYLYYYFTMAIHMVGGKSSLYIGTLLIEAGLFTLSMYSVPKIYVLVYLAATYAFSGLVDVLRAGEAKKNLSPSWKSKMILGFIYILIAVAVFVFMKEPRVAVMIYAFGLFFSAITRVVRSFQRTTDVYISA